MSATGTTAKPDLSIAIGGLGAVGRALATKLATGIPGLKLCAVSARDKERAGAWITELRNNSTTALPADVPVLDLPELANVADIVVEAAPAAVFADIASAAVEQGKLFVPISVGALLEHDKLGERARETGARIVVPTGALLGLDAVRAAAEGVIHSVRMVTRKPPRGLAGAPYLEQQGIDLDAIVKPTRIFEGSAREGARGFPANVNVAAALALAGVGPDQTRLEVWADPTVERNVHNIRVDSDSATFELKIENVPSEENPRTGRIVAQSVIATLRREVAALVIGT